MNRMPATARVPEIAGDTPATPRRARRMPLRATGMLAILALIALATVMVTSAMLFRDAVQSHLEHLEEAHARYGMLLQLRQDAASGGAERGRLEALDLQLRTAAEQREQHLATTRHYIDGSTVTTASLAWLGITSIGALALLFFSRLAGDIATVRTRALAILTGDRSAGTPLSRSDELGELGDAVDNLADALARREQELAVERRHVMHQEKLATIGSMAAGVIREIGNPIAAIDGYARAMQELRACSFGPTPATLPPACDVSPILQETARLIAITRQISGLAAAPVSRWQLASINEIVTQTLALLRYEPRMEDVAIVTELDFQLPAVMCCADRLVQLLTNLIINAADAMASLPPHSGRIEIGTQLLDGGVALRVDDNGCGISESVLQRAFEPLFTTKPAGRGTGLGLPLCRAITQEHGGRIALAARPGGGTRATVWLPLQGDEPLN
jgi:two-component system, NtrC family, sensor kinase